MNGFKNVVFRYNGILISHKDKKNFLLIAGKWMELENILREVRQFGKAQGSLFSLICEI
jgi:hypothetical protein